MECSEVRAAILEDLELDPSLKEGVEAHLEGCPSCAKLFLNLREQAQALHDLPRMEAPANFLSAVRGRVDRPSGFGLLRQKLSEVFAAGRFFRFAGVAATAVLVVVAAQIMMQGDGEKQNAPVPAPSPMETGPKSPAVPGPVPPANEPGPAPPAVQNSPEPPAVEHRPAPRALQTSPAPRLKSMPDVAGQRKSKAEGMASGPRVLSDSQAEREQPAVVLTVKLPGRLGGKPALRPESISPPREAPAAPSRRRTKRQEHAAALAPAPVNQEMRDAMARVRRLVSDSNGKVLPDEGVQGEGREPSIIAEIPAAGYRSFLDQLRRLGEIESEKDEYSEVRPDRTIRVTVHLH